MLESLIEKKHCEMGNKLTGMALAKFEAKRDVWQEVLDDIREIKARGGKRTRVDAKSYVVPVRLKIGVSQLEFAVALGVSERTLEQWKQGRRKPSGAVKQLLKVAERHPEILVEVAA